MLLELSDQFIFYKKRLPSLIIFVNFNKISSHKLDYDGPILSIKIQNSLRFYKIQSNISLLYF